MTVVMQLHLFKPLLLKITQRLPLQCLLILLSNVMWMSMTYLTGDVTDEADNCSTGLEATFTDSVTTGAVLMNLSLPELGH